MNLFERLFEDLKRRAINAFYTVDAISRDGRRFSKEFQMGEDLGKGGYGFVKLIMDKKGVRFGVKLVEKNKMLGWSREERDGDQSSAPLEFIIISKLNHPNIVKVLDLFESVEYYQLVLELVPGISLFDLIELNGALSEPVVRGLFIQITQSLSYLHSRNILHNDIKDENIMVNGEGKVTIVDFGSSCFITHTKTRQYCGSETYSSPEVLKGKPYFRKYQEIWSLGVMLFVMVCGAAPFPSVLDVEDKEPEIPPPILLSQEIKDLLENILKKLPEDRLNLEQIQDSSWINLKPVLTTINLVFN